MKVNIKEFLIMLEMAYTQKKDATLHYQECKELLDELNKLISPSRQRENVKKIYGEYQNVKLSDKEVEMLKDCYGEDLTEQLITYLDEYIEMKGYKAKSHYLCIKKWVVAAVEQNKNKTNYNTYKKPANPVPEWFNKEIKSKQATPEEIARIQEMLKDYK